jgi:hypothetical protein
MTQSTTGENKMIRYKKALLIAFAMTTLGAASTQAAVPITPGDYVRDGVQCQDAPFAALLKFDGKAFSGPHESNCTTSIVGRTGHQYRLTTTCRAAGDGSPQAPYTETQTVNVLSPSHFIFGHKTGTGAMDRAAYRLCAAPAQQ